jgi:26S proteasome regulatory subunit N7
MDMAGDDGKQQPQLVLVHKLFPLSHSHPDVDDLTKVDLRADVLAAVKSDI